MKRPTICMCFWFISIFITKRCKIKIAGWVLEAGEQLACPPNLPKNGLCGEEKLPGMSPSPLESQHMESDVRVRVNKS